MKKSLNIKLNISEIIYDVQNKTYLTGKALGNGENHSHVAGIQANDDEEDSSQVLRSVTMALSVLRNKLSEYITDEKSSSENNLVEATTPFTITLSMPSNFNSAVTQTLCDAAHQFVVATAVADWLAITAKGETADYTAVADSALKVLDEALNKRSRPLRQ